jgi:hypothetical protein
MTALAVTFTVARASHPMQNLALFSTRAMTGPKPLLFQSLFVSKQNISYSFDPREFSCKACEIDHNVLGGQGPGAERIVFVLADQCFPPVIGSTNGTNCIKIIRIEYGKLCELARAFVDLMTGVKLPVGSLILVSSASQLAEIGVAAYAEETVRCIRFLLNAFQNRVDVKHRVFITLGGIESASVIRAVAELDAWLSFLPPPP